MEFTSKFRLTLCRTYQTSRKSYTPLLHIYPGTCIWLKSTWKTYFDAIICRARDNDLYISAHARFRQPPSPLCNRPSVRVVVRPCYERIGKASSHCPLLTIIISHLTTKRVACVFVKIHNWFIITIVTFSSLSLSLWLLLDDHNYENMIINIMVTVWILFVIFIMYCYCYYNHYYYHRYH